MLSDLTLFCIAKCIYVHSIEVSWRPRRLRWSRSSRRRMLSRNLTTCARTTTPGLKAFRRPRYCNFYNFSILSISIPHKQTLPHSTLPSSYLPYSLPSSPTFWSVSPAAWNRIYKYFGLFNKLIKVLFFMCYIRLPTYFKRLVKRFLLQ